MARLIVFTPNAWADYTYWQTQDKKTLKRINTLIEAASREPFTGIAKPEALKGDLTGFWSRRIDDVHRMVYQVTESELQIVACRYHYTK
jgi:toxin YoeB